MEPGVEPGVFRCVQQRPVRHLIIRKCLVRGETGGVHGWECRPFVCAFSEHALELIHAGRTERCGTFAVVAHPEAYWLFHPKLRGGCSDSTRRSDARLGVGLIPAPGEEPRRHQTRLAHGSAQLGRLYSTV